MRNLPFKTGQLLIGLAVIMGLITMSVMSGLTKKGGKKPVEKVETAEIVVPVIPIPEGKVITLDDLNVVKWPKAYLPKGSVFSDSMQVAGRVAKQDLFPGEPIYKEKVSGSNTTGGLPALIPEGMRAVTVAVTEVKGVAGFVKPGDRVDVLTTFELEDSAGVERRVTKTVLQNVLVLASAQTMVDENRYKHMDTPEGVIRGEATEQAEEEDPKDKKKDKRKKENKDKEAEKERKERLKAKKEEEKRARLVSSVTLAVTPEQGETVALAEETGDIRLVLRPENDHKIAPVKSVSTTELLGDVLPAPTPPAAAAPPSMPTPPLLQYGSSVEVIEGTQKSNVNF